MTPSSCTGRRTFDAAAYSIARSVPCPIASPVPGPKECPVVGPEPVGLQGGYGKGRQPIRDAEDCLRALREVARGCAGLREDCAKIASLPPIVTEQHALRQEKPPHYLRE